jgi:hypothetical protein
MESDVLYTGKTNLSRSRITLTVQEDRRYEAYTLSCIFNGVSYPDHTSIRKILDQYGSFPKKPSEQELANTLASIRFILTLADANNTFTTEMSVSYTTGKSSTYRQLGPYMCNLTVVALEPLIKAYTDIKPLAQVPQALKNGLELSLQRTEGYYYEEEVCKEGTQTLAHEFSSEELLSLFQAPTFTHRKMALWPQIGKLARMALDYDIYAQFLPFLERQATLAHYAPAKILYFFLASNDALGSKLLDMAFTQFTNQSLLELTLLGAFAESRTRFFEQVHTRLHTQGQVRPTPEFSWITSTLQTLKQMGVVHAKPLERTDVILTRLEKNPAISAQFCATPGDKTLVSLENGLIAYVQANQKIGAWATFEACLEENSFLWSNRLRSQLHRLSALCPKDKPFIEAWIASHITRAQDTLDLE